MTDYAGDFHVTVPLTHTYIYGFSGDLRSSCWQLSNFSQRDRAKYLSVRSKGEKFGDFEGAHRLYQKRSNVRHCVFDIVTR